MAFNPSGAVGVPLTVFGSWVTEVAPESVPENISPDCQDIIFAPGKVGSRPGLDRVFGTPFPVGGPNNYRPTITGSFSYKLPTGSIQNLYFDSNGILWVEYFSATPGTYTQIFQSTPDTYARFVGAFGRVYIAISDGLHGADAPLQWDGTNLDRYTLDSPGVAPLAVSTTLPSSTLAGSGGGGGNPGSVIAAYPNDRGSGYIAGGYGTFTGGGGSGATCSLTFFEGLLTGITITDGGSGYTSAPTLNIYGYSGGAGATASVYISSGGGGGGGTLSLSRANNIVTAATTAAHGLQIGYQAQIAGMDALAVGGGISSIVINNEENPGIATVSTSSPHGLLPFNDVTITGVTPKLIGSSGGWSANWDGSAVTLTLGSGTHGLVPGAVVTVTDSNSPVDAFPGTFTVAAVPSPSQISYFQSGLGTTAPISATGISVGLSWPIPDDTPTPTYFEVLSCPSATTFQIQVTYSDGTWTSGTVSFPWDGTFYVRSVPSSTTFTYEQYGPNGSSTVAGTVTPWGQCAPGLHLMAVCFLDRQGGITAPSAFTTFISNGGQYVSVSGVPIGPPSTVARILVFTGAQPNVPGELPPFFYIPNVPQLEGQIVGTATQINDNSTTSVILDFSDDTLYAAIGISIPGNDLANQIVIEGALAFGSYQSRLTTWGQRNIIENLLNMGFEGGYISGAPTVPAGWTVATVGTSEATGSLVAARWASGVVWQVSLAANVTSGLQISKSAYLDAYGDPILTGGTQYGFRLWVQPSAIGSTEGYVVAILSSASTSFSTSVAFANSQMSANGGYLEGAFSAETPASIPTDMTLTVQALSGGAAGTIGLDEMSLYFIETPYTDEIAYGSYLNNPSALDGITGQFGADDPAKLMDTGILRDTLYLLTQAPSGRLHETNGSGQTEPSGWQIAEVAANCGTLSAFGLTHSQADDTAASGGDDWMAWPSEGGAFIFGGGQPEKISQEIQPNWYDPTQSDTSIQINMNAATTCWGLNDPVDRLLMFGLPIGTATAPSQIYVLNYRNLQSAQQIAGSPPFHPSFAGKLIATDNSRKWTHWYLSMNNAARMYREDSESLSMVLCGGNGSYPGAAPWYGNVYTLNPALLTDEDYGLIVPYYTTYFFLDPEKAQALQLRGGRILLAYLMAYVQGTGNLTATYYPDSLNNPWALTTTRLLNGGYFDREFGGGSCTGNRIAVKLGSSPITGTDNGFTLSRFTAFVKDAKLGIRGANQ